MTLTPSDAQPVAYRSRWSGDSQWGLHLSPRLIRGDDAEDFIQEPLYPQSALDAERQKREAAERAQVDATNLMIEASNAMTAAEARAEAAEAAEASLAKANARIAELADTIRRLFRLKAPLSVSAIEENGAVIRHARAVLSNIEKERDDDR